MTKNVMVVTVDKRKDNAVAAQKIMTEWGCIIHTRLGLHNEVLENCSEHGIIILELVGEMEKQKQFEKLLANLPGVKTHLVELNLNN
ncbi:MAG: hypothetical protein ABIH39_03090 [Candidatus Margulisiibacteriota bacterium]